VTVVLSRNVPESRSAHRAVRDASPWSDPLEQPHERDEDDSSNEADKKVAQEAAGHEEMA
jgi:hypothetical protein